MADDGDSSSAESGSGNSGNGGSGNGSGGGDGPDWEVDPTEYEYIEKGGDGGTETRDSGSGDG